MITSILSRVMGGARGRRGAGAGTGTAGGRRGSTDAAVGRGVRSLLRRVR